MTAGGAVASTPPSGVASTPAAPHAARSGVPASGPGHDADAPLPRTAAVLLSLAPVVRFVL